MCGISGVFALDGQRTIDPALVAGMNRRLQHRGPDRSGTYLNGPIGLGCQRLAIIDLALGNQPLSSADGSLWIVFNGEIYNHAELRRLLEAQGLAFRTRSDTEVILQAYAARGADCVRLLDGMFAFAVWDERRRTLFLARDRLGIKPLFYTWQPPSFAFASEAKALLTPPLRPASANPAALGEALACGYPLEDGTLFQGILRLPPGHCLQVTPRGPVLHQYWDVRFTPATDNGGSGAPALGEASEPADPRHEQVLRRTCDLLERSVARQLGADVPLGCCLSGGLDSSVVAALASRRRPGLPTFSIGYAANSALFRRSPQRIVGEVVGDDAQYAAVVAQALGTDHRGLTLPTDRLLEDLDRMIWHREKPLVTLAEHGHFRLHRAATHGVKVLLSGQGADELFGGYYYWWRGRDAANTRTFPWLWQGRDPAGTQPVSTTDILDGLVRDEVKRDIDAPARVQASFQGAMHRAQTADFFNQLSYLFVKFHLPEMLEIEDRHSMASSVEVRVPFLDHRIVSWILNLPASVKVPGGQDKFLLRSLARVHLPELPAIVWRRRKSPMPPPFDTGDLFRGMTAVLRAPNLELRTYLDPGRLSAFLDEVEALPAGSPIGPQHYALFRLYGLERWHHIFRNGWPGAPERSGEP